MNRTSACATTLALLLTVTGCGMFTGSRSQTRVSTPGISVAEAALQGGAGQIALQVSESILREYPGNLAALEIKGEAMTLLGQYDEATDVFQGVLAKNPASARATIGLGRIKLASDPAAAEALFQKALTRDPTDQTALNNLGIARDLQGRHAEAQTTYRQALALNPVLESAQVNLALSLAMSGQGPAAVQMLRQRASAPDASIKIRHDYAVVLAMAGQRSEAERVLGETMSADQVREALDAVTGTRTRVARETPPRTREPRQAADTGADAPAPEPATRPYGRPARVASPRMEQPAARPSWSQPSWSQMPVASAPPPMVVRPRETMETDMTVTPTAGPPPAMAGTRQQGFPGSPPMTGTMRVQDGAPSPSVIITTPRPSPSTPVFSNGQSEPASGPIAVPMPPVEAPARVTQPTAPSTEVPPRATAETPVPPIPAARSSLERPETPSPGARSSFEEKTGAPLAARPEERAAVAPRSSTLLSSASVAARQAMMTQTFLPPSAASQETPRETPRETVVAPREGGARDAGSRDAVNADIRRQVTEARDKYDPTAAAPPRVARQPTGNAPMVQFSAAPSEAAANALWSELLQRFPGMLSNHEPIVIRVERGNSVFWRLRTEAGNPGEARTLCSRLRAAGQDCFIPTL